MDMLETKLLLTAILKEFMILPIYYIGGSIGNDTNSSTEKWVDILCDKLTHMYTTHSVNSSALEQMMRELVATFTSKVCMRQWMHEICIKETCRLNCYRWLLSAYTKSGSCLIWNSMYSMLCSHCLYHTLYI